MNAARPKLKKFALKISWCAQLAVLSLKNANIVSELSSSCGVEGVRWCWFAGLFLKPETPFEITIYPQLQYNCG